MGAFRTAFLSVAAAALIAVAIVKTAGVRDSEALCDGRRYKLSAVANGASPYVELSADGVSGRFLLDYGATKSSFSATAFAGPDGFARIADLSLPGFKGGAFALRRYDMPLQPAGQQLGVIGADLLSHLSAQFSGDAVFLGAEPCKPDALRAQNFVPIAQRGFFSSDLARIDSQRPNVPVVFLRLGDVHAWAQIDTGYDDVIYPHSVDINQALFERLSQSGVALDRLADISVSTCQGSESRQVYAVKDQPLVIETDQTAPIRRIDAFHLILKPTNGCGGIAAMTVPAAQLGASFLRLFGAVIFDPASETVWLQRQPPAP